MNLCRHLAGLPKAHPRSNECALPPPGALPFPEDIPLQNSVRASQRMANPSTAGFLVPDAPQRIPSGVRGAAFESPQTQCLDPECIRNRKTRAERSGRFVLVLGPLQELL